MNFKQLCTEHNTIMLSEKETAILAAKARVEKEYADAEAAASRINEILEGLGTLEGFQPFTLQKGDRRVEFKLHSNRPSQGICAYLLPERNYWYVAKNTKSGDLTCNPHFGSKILAAFFSEGIEDMVAEKLYQQDWFKGGRTPEPVPYVTERG